MRFPVTFFLLTLSCTALAQDTIRLEPTATIPTTNIFQMTETTIIATAEALADEGDYRDSLMVIDIGNLYHPRVTGNVLPLRTISIWDFHRRVYDWHADAVLKDGVVIASINSTEYSGDIPPFYRRIGRLRLAAESLDHRIRWSITIQDTLEEIVENPDDFQPLQLPWKLAIYGDILYFAAGSWGLRVYDVSDPVRPHELNRFDYYTNWIELKGSLLFMEEIGRLVVLDLSTPESPAEVWRRIMGSEQFPYRGFYTLGEYVVMQNTNEQQDVLEFTVFDFGNPAEPEIVGGFELPITSRYYKYWINSGRFYLEERDILSVYNIREDFSPVLWKCVTFADLAAPLYPFGRLVIAQAEQLGWQAPPEAHLFDLEANAVPPINSPLLTSDFALLTCFPNPFNSSTTITYTLPRPGRYAVDVVDISGRLVTKLSDGWKEAGSYREVWDGGRLTSGQYLLQISGTNTVNSTPITIIR